MKNRTVLYFKFLSLIPSVLLLILAIVTLFFSKQLFVYAICIASLSVLASFLINIYIKHNVTAYFSNAAKSVDEIGSQTLVDFILPVLVTDGDSSIVWYNNTFSRTLLKHHDVYGEPVQTVIDDTDLIRLHENGKSRISYKDKKYMVFEYSFGELKNNQKMYYFVDDTNNYAIASSYKMTRPCVMFIQIDGIDILLKDIPESRKTEIMGQIEKQIEGINESGNGYIQKLNADKYLYVCDAAEYDRISGNKFSALNNVRSLDLGDEVGTPSLSIGVGIGGENIAVCVDFARQALNMAQGRGGDQAVIKNKEDIKFFGGVTQSKQGSSKVRTRLMATTLAKLIQNAENLLVMGHKFSDMDCYGAAFALCSAACAVGKEAKIVLDEDHTLSSNLIRYTRTAKNADYIISPIDAQAMITKKTLLIIVDTQRPGFLESKTVYDKTSTVVVIDHHRQMVDHIDDALLFYHDPVASSTCEMVIELLQYMGKNLVGKIEAEALLAGIMLDTKNYVLSTHSRTFEASAYLCDRGADSVTVKQMFAEDISVYAMRSSIVATAEVSNGYAISYCDIDDNSARIAAAQAADELLSIKGVNASFVMFKNNGKISISARSYGKVNVQIIMEQIGGGGHRTMAAAQPECVDFNEGRELIIKAINAANSIM